MLQRQSWALVTDVIWITNPQLLTIWLFKEKKKNCADPCSRTILKILIMWPNSVTLAPYGPVDALAGACNSGSHRWEAPWALSEVKLRQVPAEHTPRIFVRLLSVKHRVAEFAIKKKKNRTIIRLRIMHFVIFFLVLLCVHVKTHISGYCAKKNHAQLLHRNMDWKPMGWTPRETRALLVVIAAARHAGAEHPRLPRSPAPQETRSPKVSAFRGFSGAPPPHPGKEEV